MKSCELCGKNTEYLIKANIEGSTLEICYECASRYNVKIKDQNIINIKKEEKENYKKTEDDEIVLIENYNEIITKARNEKKLTQEQMAKELGISLIKYRQIEHKVIEPDKKLINKIEKILNIKLTEDTSYEEDMEDIEIVIIEENKEE